MSEKFTKAVARELGLDPVCMDSPLQRIALTVFIATLFGPFGQHLAARFPSTFGSEVKRNAVDVDIISAVEWHALYVHVLEHGLASVADYIQYRDSIAEFKRLSRFRAIDRLYMNF